MSIRPAHQVELNTPEGLLTGFAALADSSLDPLFWHAERLGTVSAWWAHVPFAFWLVTNARPDLLVELGTQSGISYSAFCEAVLRQQLPTRCFAIDTWEGDEQAGRYGDHVYREFSDFHDVRYGAFSMALKTTFDAAVDKFEDASIDLLHIDGLHTYAAVKHDFETWFPKLSNSAMVLFHDTNQRQDDFGVGRLWRELSQRFPSFEFIHGGGLGVLGTGAEIGGSLNLLLSLEDAAVIARIRERFAFVGERWACDMRERHLRAEFLDRENSVRAAEERRERLENSQREITGSLQLVESQLESARKAARAEAKARIEERERAKAAKRQLEQELSEVKRELSRAKAVAESERALAELAGVRVGQAVSPAISEALTQPEASPETDKDENPSDATLTEAERELERQIQLVSRSPLFDEQWYYEQYPDVAGVGAGALIHYLKFGGAEGRNPGPDFDSKWYMDRYPDVSAADFNPLVHYLDWGVAEGREIRPVMAGGSDTPAVPAVVAVRARYGSINPLNVLLVRGSKPALSLVTDSVNSGSLFGGVGTALILAVLIAKRLNMPLRIVTRTEVPNTRNVGEVLRVNGIEWDQNIEFTHSPHQYSAAVPVSEHDIFLTMSWWTTKSALGSVPNEKIIYLLQEDERMFYPLGDERLRCRETLENRDVHFIINSQLLFEHFTTGCEPLPNLAERGVWFEPAFPPSHYYPDPERLITATRKKFFFYARPQNVRNLYWRGLETINAAIEERILTADEWDFYFAGRALERVVFPGGITPTLQENLPWADYAALVRSMDVGLCLMDTPHPSYPPLDLAASGAVAVTNRHGIKKSLDQYSTNIICADPTVDSLKEAISTATNIASDVKRRLDNYCRNKLLRDWNTALTPAVDATLARMGLA